MTLPAVRECARVFKSAKGRVPLVYKQGGSFILCRMYVFAELVANMQVNRLKMPFTVSLG